MSSQQANDRARGEEQVLSQDFVLGFNYTRSTGPVIGRFLTGLREKRIWGVVGSDGGVIVPPAEYDPKTAAALDQFVEVGQSGEVVTWCWVEKPHPKHPLQRPFAWALILLDGAATPMLHAVAAPDAAVMRAGLRVAARWVDEPRGMITDIACFEPA